MKIRILFASSLFVTCAFGQTSVSLTRDYNFPPVGLSTSETAQMNVVNISAPSATAGEAPACTGTITFANASGAVIGKPTSFTTTGSQVTSVQLTYSQLQLPTSDTRGEFVASVQLMHALLPVGACSLVFSLETFDTTSGVTHVYLGNSAAAPALIGNPIAVHTPGAN